MILRLYETTQKILLKEGQPPVKLEASGGQHLEDHHHVMSGRVPVESGYDSVPDTDTTPIKPIDDDEMDHLL